ncbi:F420-0:Gamma-glutamyl ligase [Oscillatoria sp. CS-180]|uniref:F420-0:Gamma-glutamyl ligase n=1 Tax=Oscillatoria sp. CS-180 TaxID=3021720 RepID=UPI0023310EAA|nr:F420-0:Gamma-glutamyl ligase [Oscillatoria sp. CS-180]MDB9528613.1 F420-0:Gamma-glutamyl ligase [Oscillatoria sp. CS-180]
MILVWLLGAIALLGLLIWGWLEWQYRQRPGNRLAFAAGQWNLEQYDSDHYQILGTPELINRTQALEIMVPELTAETTLLSGDSLDGIQVNVSIVPNHPDAEARSDGYWFAYIVKLRKRTQFKVQVDITGPGLRSLKALWVRIHYMTYGPGGRIPKTGHVIVPLKFPKSDAIPAWRTTPQAEVLPIPTHLLTHLDTSVEVIKRYVAPHAKPGDIVTLGETPLAIMQGRWRHPATVQPGWLARRLCYYFLPTSSLATACGLQTLVDVVGAWRVFFAFVGGAFMKAVLRRGGGFYQLAGEQARLIDDVTGTLPPYDQFIVLGPEAPQLVVDEIEKATGLGAAIVDVNDLKAVKIVAASASVNAQLVAQALIDNPAGNADEQTPLVLVRPLA